MGRKWGDGGEGGMKRISFSQFGQQFFTGQKIAISEQKCITKRNI